MKIKVLRGGQFTTIQDRGRFSYEAYGVPQNGYLDTFSAEYANSLVGNNVDEALFEITATGPTLLFDSDCLIAITGADISPKINHKRTKNEHLIELKKDDVLSFGKLKAGFRAYLAIRGSIDVKGVYGSKSTNTISGFGGYKGRPLKKGDELDVILNSNSVKTTKTKPTMLGSQIIQIEKGPEFEMFTFQEVSKFMQQVFTVSNDSNRMGYRLNGTWLKQKKLATIVSSGNIPGVIQITPSLQPIVLLNDAGTTGGYPRIAVCTQSGISALAQLKPFDNVEFTF